MSSTPTRLTPEQSIPAWMVTAPTVEQLSEALAKAREDGEVSEQAAAAWEFTLSWLQQEMDSRDRWIGEALKIAEKRAADRSHIAALEAERERLRAMLSDVREVIANSDGVTGWHRNGDVATWDEFSWPDEIDAALQGQQGEGGQ